jgi:hypothetical protein
MTPADWETMNRMHTEDSALSLAPQVWGPPPPLPPDVVLLPPLPVTEPVVERRPRRAYVKKSARPGFQAEGRMYQRAYTQRRYAVKLLEKMFVWHRGAPSIDIGEVITEALVLFNTGAVIEKPDE